MSNMKIAYLHGLESKVGGPKVDWLLLNGHNVISPKMDYSDVNTFRDTLHLLEMYKPDLIIGSSMGGWFGYWLSKLTGIDAVLFNPAMHGRIFEPKVNKRGRHKAYITVVLGSNDNIIDPIKSAKILNRKNVWIMNEDNGHRTPLKIFKKYVK